MTAGDRGKGFEMEGGTHQSGPRKPSVCLQNTTRAKETRNGMETRALKQPNSAGGEGMRGTGDTEGTWAEDAGRTQRGLGADHRSAERPKGAGRVGESKA